MNLFSRCRFSPKKSHDEIMALKIDKEIEEQKIEREKLINKINKLKFQLLITDKAIEANRQVLLESGRLK